MRVKRKTAITGFSAVLLAIFGLVLFFKTNFEYVIVSGNSMEPTFMDKDKILTSRAYWLVGQIKDGDVVVIKNPESEGEKGYLIKRVHRMAGEKVDFLNVPETHRLADGEYVVPPDSVYVIGDNREVSEDSRRFGPLNKKEILGKYVIRW
jgi:signal peptidase I